MKKFDDLIWSEAVLFLKKGYIVQRPDKKPIKSYMGNLILHLDGKVPTFDVEAFESKKWMVIDRKETLSDKHISTCPGTSILYHRKILYMDDVRETLKEFIEWCGATHVREKAKELFGEEVGLANSMKELQKSWYKKNRKKILKKRRELVPKGDFHCNHCKRCFQNNKGLSNHRRSYHA